MKPPKSENDNPYLAYADTNGDLKKFTDYLLSKKGRAVELYIGDQCETLNFDEVSVPKNCSIFGIILDVLDRVLILDCFYVDRNTKQLRSGNEIVINTFQIRAMTDLHQNGSLGDVFLSVEDADKIRKLCGIIK